MKMAVLALVFGVLLQMDGIAQNHIKEWDAKKITSVTIDIRSSGTESAITRISKKAGVDSILAYLRRVDFRAIHDSRFNKSKTLKDWMLKLTFDGSHDLVVICRNYAEIGKTMYETDVEVAQILKKVIARAKLVK